MLKLILFSFCSFGTRKKEHRFFVENQSTSLLPDFLAPKSAGNVKVKNRRVTVLNSVFLERISEILVSSRHDHGSTNVHQHGFFVTKVFKSILQKMDSLCNLINHNLLRLNLKVMDQHFMYIGMQIKTAVL
jgi:hypothetical protein